jgi:hypothetical protein
MERVVKSPTQDRTVSLSLAITGAQLKAQKGETAQAIRDLEATLEEARKMQMIDYEFEARLAQAKVELLAGKMEPARAHLIALQDEASGKGFRLVARRAAQAETAKPKK